MTQTFKIFRLKTIIYFFLCEIWLGNTDCELCDFHVFLPVQRTKCERGGLLCSVKEWLKPFVSISDIIFYSIIWLKIEKNFWILILTLRSFHLYSTGGKNPCCVNIEFVHIP